MKTETNLKEEDVTQIISSYYELKKKREYFENYVSVMIINTEFDVDIYRKLRQMDKIIQHDLLQLQMHKQPVQGATVIESKLF